MKKLTILSSFILLFAGMSYGQQIIITCSPGNCPAAGSISVSANPTQIIPGQSSILSAQLLDVAGNPNVDITSQCAWSSSNSAILSVSGNVATGVASGSATANCTDGGLAGTTPVTISVSTIVFTNPVQSSCANPCILPQGTNAVAYSFTFAASSSAGGAYTWAVTVGSIPAWASLNASTGALTGTPNANATTNFTIQVTDGSSNTATLPVSLTIVAASTCGPPSYACSSTSTSNPGPISAPLSSTTLAGFVNTSNSTIGLCVPTAPQGCAQWVSGSHFSASWPGQIVTINGLVYNVQQWNSDDTATLKSHPGTQSNVPYANYAACSGNCQNYTFHDTTINPATVDCITRMTDGSSFGNGRGIGNFTYSGGSNDVMWSANEDYLGITDSGGNIYVYSVALSSGCLQVQNPGVPVIRVTKPNFAFDRTNDAVFYSMSDGHTLKQYTIASIGTMPTPTTIVDLAGTGVCPGVSPGFTDVFGVFDPSVDGQTFSTLRGIQNTALWSIHYNRTLGCSTVNWQTGQVWGWCTGGSCGPSTTPLGTLATSGDSCWGANGTSSGIHDAIQSFGGTYYFITLSGAWTQGICNGSTDTVNQFISYQIGTLHTSYCNAKSNNCGSHSSVGYNTLLSPSFNGWNSRALSDVGGAFTNFAPGLPAEDSHQTWPLGTGADSYPWVGASGAVLLSAGGVFNPQYANNLVFAVLLSPPGTKVFVHTYACGPPGGTFDHCPGAIDGSGSGDAISVASPKGNYECWASSMLHSMGTDASGQPRADGFCVHLQ